MADTRKDKRAPVSLKVRFKSATVDEFIVQYAADISRGGVFIKSKSPMPVGTLLKFEIQLKDESPLIHGVGRVVWKRDAGDAAGADPSGMGIKFIRMDPECRVMVDRIVDQRGDAPGQFEAGGGDNAMEEPAPVESVAPPTREVPATREVKPRKATMPFFPAAGPTEAELPRPEDRTQVRHASEFLASALAEAGADEAAREAERRAEETRKRQEELERQRIAAAERDARAAQDAERAKAEAEAEAERAEARARADAETAKAAAITAATASASVTDLDEPKAAAAGAADTVPATTKAKPVETTPAETRPAEKKAAAKPAEKPAEKKADIKPAEKRPSKAPPAVVAASMPAEEPKSYGVPIAIGLAAVLGLSAVVWSQTGGRTDDPETTTATAPVEGTEEIGEPATEELPPEGEVVAGAEELPGTEEGTAPVEGTPVVPGTEEAAAAGAEEAPAAPMAQFRVETTPPGATISVGGREAGTSPADIEAPIGAATTITARLAGYREGTQEVTPTATQRPVRMTLVAMPYVLEVTTTPPGVRVRVGGRTATTAAGAPSRMTLPRPGAALTVTGTRTGYVDATQTVAPTAFTERDGEMVATVSLTLAERPAAAPPATTTARVRPPRETPAETGGEAGGETGGTTETAPTPTPEPTPEPEPEAPPPPPREEPTEAPPDNPF